MEFGPWCAEQDLCNGTVSVCLSVCLSVPSAAACGGLLLLWVRKAGDIDRLLHQRRATDECGQCHVYSWRRRLNIDWLLGRIAVHIHCVPQKREPPKHFATATANLHRFKWNFIHTRRHLFLSSTSNFIRIPYSIYEMFNSFKLLSQVSVTDTTYFLLTSSVETHDLWVMLFKNSHFSKVKADLYETM